MHAILSLLTGRCFYASLGPRPGFGHEGAKERRSDYCLGLASAKQMLAVPHVYNDVISMQGPPPGFPLPGLACASQPAPSTNTPAEHVTQHASRSTAMVCLIL